MLRVRVYTRVLIRFGANPSVLVLVVKLHLPKGKLQLFACLAAFCSRCLFDLRLDHMVALRLIVRSSNVFLLPSSTTSVPNVVKWTEILSF